MLSSHLRVGLSRFADDRGQVLPLVAAALLALLLTLGLIVDGGNGFQNKQSVQNAADAAAFAAAQAVSDANYYCKASDPDVNSAVADCAGQYAGLNGVSGSGNGNITTTTNGTPAAPLPSCSNLPHPQPPVTATQPPISSNAPGCYVYPYNGKAGQVEVWLTRKTSNFFGNLLGITTSTETARAVASLTAGGPAPPFSFVTLESDGENHTLFVKAGSQLNVDNSLYDDSCGAVQLGCQYVTGGNGNANDSFDINEGGGGGALLDKKSEYVVGGWENGAKGSVGANGGVCAALNGVVTAASPPIQPGGTFCPTIQMPYLPDPFALLPQPTLGNPPPGGGGTRTFTVTQKAASGGVATLTAINNLQPGTLITVSGVDANFNGTYTVSSASATQVSYVDSNLPATTTISPTAVAMNNGTATVTVANNLAAGNSVTVHFGNVNYDGTQTVTNPTNGTSFSYLPAIPVPVVSGSITGGVASLTTSGPAGIPTGAGNSVTVATGDGAYDGTNVAVTSTGTAATSFTYTPPQIANVSWTVNSATSATFTTTGKHDTNITSVKVSGGGLPASLNNQTFAGGNLSVGSNTFTVTGSGFSSTTAYPGPAGPVNLNGALTLAATSVPIKWGGGPAQATNDPVAVGDTIQIDSEQMSVTARSAAANNQATLTVTRHANGTTAATHANNAAVNKVTLPTGANANVTVNTATSTTFSPSFPNAIETAVNIASIQNPGTVTVPYFLAATNSGGTITGGQSSAANPFPDVMSSGTLQPGTYYGGICLGSSNGTDCTGNDCAASGSSGGSTAYNPPVTINAPGPPAPGGITAAQTNVPIQWMPMGTDPVSVNDVILVDSEEMLVTQITPAGGPMANMQATLTVQRGYGGTTAATHANMAPVTKFTAPSGGGGTTVTMQQGEYIMAGGGFQVCGNVTLSAPNVLIYSTNDPSAPNATYGKVGQVELNTGGSVTLGPQTVAQDPLYAGFTIWEDRNQVVVPPSSFTPSSYGQKYQLASNITADNRVFDVTPTAGASCSTQTAANQAPACIAAGNLIQIGNEMMMVTLVTPDGTNEKITVTRGYYQTAQATHSAGAAVQSVNQGGTVCDMKRNSSIGGLPATSNYDVAFLRAGTANGASGPLSTISGTIYDAGPRADFENNLLGVANLAVISSCVFINSGAVPNGSPTSEFAYNPNGGNGLAGIEPQLSG
jgi:Flp pilus assembly protein TadG